MCENCEKFSPTTSHGKQEDDLNAIIRRMIMMELKRHRKKETVLKRAHSDTESTLARKRRSEDSRYRRWIWRRSQFR